MFKEMEMNEAIHVNGGGIDHSSPNSGLVVAVELAVVGTTSTIAGIAAGGASIIYAGYVRLKDEEQHPEKYAYIKYQHNNDMMPSGSMR